MFLIVASTEVSCCEQPLVLAANPWNVPGQRWLLEDKYVSWLGSEAPLICQTGS